MQLQPKKFDQMFRDHGVAIEYYLSMQCPNWRTDRGETEIDCSLCNGYNFIWLSPPLQTIGDAIDTGTVVLAASFTITLKAGFTYKQDLMKQNSISIISGTGSGQARRVSSYNMLTRVATLTSNWDTIPDATSHYEIRRTLKATVTHRDTMRNRKEAGNWESGVAFASLPPDVPVSDMDKVVMVDDRVVINDEVLTKGKLYPDGATRERLRFNRIFGVDYLRTKTTAYVQGVDFSIASNGQVQWIGNQPMPGENYTVRYSAVPEYVIFKDIPRFRRDAGVGLPFYVQLKRLDKAVPSFPTETTPMPAVPSSGQVWTFISKAVTIDPNSSRANPQAFITGIAPLDVDVLSNPFPHFSVNPVITVSEGQPRRVFVDPNSIQIVDGHVHFNAWLDSIGQASTTYKAIFVLTIP